MKILFKAKNLITYHSLELDCYQPGEYEVSKEKAKQLLSDFPEDFEVTKPVEDSIELVTEEQTSTRTRKRSR